ncbi:MAG: DUF418 domain-containing protein [Segetibacter sp.]
MNTSPTLFIPVGQTERIYSLDILRGIILLGILLMNIGLFGLAKGDPSVAGGITGVNLYVWMTTNMFFEGTMRGLFSLLFGVGMYVLTSRLENQGGGIDVADIYFRRTLWLIVFGLVHAYLLLWYGEILFDYGLMGLLIFSFRNMAPKKLVLIALFLMICGTVWNYADYRSNLKLQEEITLAKAYKAEGKALTKDLKGAYAKSEEQAYKHSAAYVTDYNENMRKGYSSIVAFLAPINLEDDTIYPYRFAVWDVMGMMLLGIALFKWNVVTAQRSYKTYLCMVAVGYITGLWLNYYELQIILNSKFSPLGFSQANLTFYWSRFFTSLGHLGLIMIFCKLSILTWFKVSLAAVGKMALTNYLMHSVICMIVFTGAGFGMFGRLQRYELYYVVFAIWVFQLIVSPIWLSYFRFGPAEWLWCSLTYLKIQPMKKPRALAIPFDKVAVT